MVGVFATMHRFKYIMSVGHYLRGAVDLAAAKRCTELELAELGPPVCRPGPRFSPMYAAVGRFRSKTSLQVLGFIFTHYTAVVGPRPLSSSRARGEWLMWVFWTSLAKVMQGKGCILFRGTFRLKSEGTAPK